MAEIPKAMRSLVAPKPCNPGEYEVRSVPVPTISDPDEVLLRIHATGMNTGDTIMASGQMSLFLKFPYPAKLGVEGSGVVVAVGSGVTDFKVGDEVYGFYMDKPMTKYPMPGFASEYALCRERFLLRKPAHVSFEEAAALLGFVVTSLQSIRRGLQLRGWDPARGLEGRTVFVPGALSGTGSVVLQVARHVFGAERILSTVSTAKLPLVEEYLPAGAAVDRLVDYTVPGAVEAIRGLADMAVNTQRTSLDDCVVAVNRDDGIIISLVEGFSKETMREMLGLGVVWGGVLGVVLDLMRLYFRGWKLGGTGVLFDGVSGSMNIREDLEEAGRVIAGGKVKPVMRVVALDDLEAVRRNCEQLRTGKGGVGKLVIKIV